MKIYKLISKLLVVLFLVSWLSAIYDINYLYRDVILLLILSFTIMTSITENGLYISKSVFLFLTIAIIGATFGAPNSFSELMISLRAVVLYPALFWVGRLLYKNNIKIKNLVYIYLGLATVLSIFAVIELILPSVFQAILAFFRIQYNSLTLLRGGIGYGVGSLFVSRQYLAIFLTLAIAIVLNIEKYTNKSYGIIKWGMALLYFIIIALTLSRTTIITAIVLIIYNFVVEFSFEKALKIFLPGILLFFTFSRLQVIQTAIASMTDSLSAMDLTMSGRTKMWEKYLGNIISIKPNFAIVGNSLMGDSLGTADSTYVRILIAFGIPLSVIIFAILVEKFILIFQIKNDKKLFMSFIITFGIASFAMDLSFVFMFCVPLYVLIGHEYEILYEDNYII